MNNRQPDFSRQSGRLQVYLESLTRAAGHADRVIPIENYTKGLLLPIARKSVEPMAARLAPGNVRQMHQSLHHIVADAAWSGLNSSKVTIMVSGVLLIEAPDNPRPVHKLCPQTQHPKQDHHLESPRARPEPLPALSFDASQQVVQKQKEK